MGRQAILQTGANFVESVGSTILHTSLEKTVKLVESVGSTILHTSLEKTVKLVASTLANSLRKAAQCRLERCRRG